MLKFQYKVEIRGILEVDDTQLSDYDIDPFQRDKGKREFDVATYLNRICNRITNNHKYWTTTGFGVSEIRKIFEDGSSIIEHHKGGCGGC